MYKEEGLQLLPGTKKRLSFKVPGENRFLYIGSAILGAVIVLSFALGRYELALRSQVEQVNTQLVNLEQKRNKGDQLHCSSQADCGISDRARNKGYFTRPDTAAF